MRDNQADQPITISPRIIANRSSFDLIRLDKKWVTAEMMPRWYRACDKPGKGLVDDDLRGILPDLYSHFPQPGEPTHQEMPVLLKQGQDIGEHKHPEWTLIYYVYIGDPAVPIVIDTHVIRPENGSAVLLPPGTPHRVPKSASPIPRLSLALRWKVNGK